jgi:hypothetical protein
MAREGAREPGAEEGGGPGERKGFMKAYKSMAWTGTVALLLAGLVGNAQGMVTKRNNNNPDPKVVSALLVDAKTMAAQAKDDAFTMESYSQMAVPWGDHAAAIGQIREHVLAMNRQVAELKAAEGGAEPWQKNVIERIEPYLAEIAQNNQAAIDEMNQHPSLFGTPAWNAYLQANADSATYLAGLIANYVNNGAMRQKMQDYDQPEDTCGLSGVAGTETRS